MRAGGVGGCQAENGRSGILAMAAFWRLAWVTAVLAALISAGGGSEIARGRWELLSVV